MSSGNNLLSAFLSIDLTILKSIFQLSLFGTNRRNIGAIVEYQKRNVICEPTLELIDRCLFQL